MTRDALELCAVRIEGGKLFWSSDGSPVTLPMRAELPETPRSAALTALIEERLTVTRRREKMLCEARAAVEACVRDGRAATPENLSAIVAPLIADGLLRALRDPYFFERPISRPMVQDAAGYLSMWEQYKVRIRWTASGDLVDLNRAGPAYVLPSDLPDCLLPQLGWEDVLCALDHEVGLGMKDGPLQTADERLRPNKPGKGGIFTVDQYGTMYAAQKVSGVLHHSSLTGGHCCRFAGSITVEDGRVLKVTPHSGHYVPTQAEYDALIESWRQAGLDLSQAELGGLVKQKRH